jgi:hypothetical protein
MTDTLTYEDISKETIALIKAATNGVNSSTGIQGVDLTALISLVPVETPFRNMMPRETPDMGSKVAEWRALLNINNQQPNPSVAYDAAGNLAKIQEQDVFAPYEPLAMGYTVTEDSIALARGYANAKAVAIYNAINQWKIGEDRKTIGACAFALTAPTTPTLATATTGGTIPLSTAVHVGVAVRSMSGYFYGTGNSQGSAATITTGSGTSTNTVSATTASVRGGALFDWYQSPDGATWHYYTSTTIPAVTMTKVITTNQAAPALADISSTVPSFTTAGDNGSAGANEFNGLFATLAGDYGNNSIVTPGTGTSSGASWIDSAGAQFTASGGGIAQLDELNLAIYNAVKLSPTAYMLNPQEANSISNLVLDSPGAVTYLTMNDENGRGEIVAGGSIATYVNRAKPGAKIRLEVHPNVTPGTVIARTDKVNFPNSQITQVMGIRCQRDLYQYVYGSDRNSGGPREDGESRAIETFMNRAPVAMGVIQSVAAS